MTGNQRVGLVRILCSAALVAAACIGGAMADEYVVSQKSRIFTPALLKAKLGDSVVFLNDDRFAHNIFSETPAYEFDIRKQMPGDRHLIELTKRGTFEVRCAIHPLMRMRIVVE